MVRFGIGSLIVGCLFLALVLADWLVRTLSTGILDVLR